MLQGIRASSLTMPPFGHDMTLAGVHKVDGYSDTGSWHWPQPPATQSHSYTPIFDPALYAHLAPSLPAPGRVHPRHHSLATSHVIDTGTSTPPPPRQQLAGSMVKAQPAFKATWHGFLDSTKDAMTIVEAALQGRLSHISRRPHDKERAEMLTSGTVLVYEENASGIKRWTDAVHWSPSRVMNNCLIYRQLVRALKPEEKKSALNPSCGTKRKRKEDAGPTSRKTGERDDANSEDEFDTPGFDSPDASSNDPTGKVYANFAQSLTPDQQRRYCGSLIDSYEFKEGGLMKKTISVKCRGSTHHIISYYSLEDVVAGKLKRPYQDAKLADVQPGPELLNGWKVSLEDEESKDMPVIAGYPHQLQPSHIHHQQHLGAVTQSMGTHGMVQHAPLHLHVPEYYSYTAMHQSPQSYSAASQYASQQLPPQYSPQQLSPQHYSQTAQPYPQAPSPQPYVSQQGPAQQYPSPATSTHQYTSQTQQPAQQLSSELKAAPVPQYHQPVTSAYPAQAPQYTPNQGPQPPQYTVPQAPVFDIHVPVHPHDTPEEHKSQTPIPQHGPHRRASAPVASQTHIETPYHGLPQTSYYVDQKYTPNSSFGF